MHGLPKSIPSLQLRHFVLDDALVAMALIDYHWLENYAREIYIGNLVLLVLVLFIGLQQLWEKGAAFAAAMLVAAVITSKRWSPGLAWKNWKIARARARLSVIEGGMSARSSKPAKPKSDSERY